MKCKFCNSVTDASIGSVKQSVCIACWCAGGDFRTSLSDFSQKLKEEGGLSKVHEPLREAIKRTKRNLQ